MTVSVLALVAGPSWAQEQTGPLSTECGGPEVTNAYGPFDYTNPDHFKNKLPVVERVHFSRKVESLKEGINQPLPGSDLDYTLRAFPNHHRALDSMGRYHLRYPNTVKPPNVNWSADCYFRRAIAFRPRDGVARMVYGIFLVRSGRLDDAERRYKEAIELMPNPAEAHYNLSLLYISREQYEQARRHAIEAYELGFPLDGVKNKLKRLGEWQDRGGQEKAVDATHSTATGG